MCSIHFNILFPPDDKKRSEPDKCTYIESQCEELKRKLSAHEIYVEAYNFIKLHQHNAHHSSVTEFIVSAQAIDEKHSSVKKAFDHIRDIWTQINNNVSRHIPMLSLGDERAFHSGRVPEHTVQYRSIKLGVLPFSGLFVYYTTFPSYNILQSQNNYINFDHSTRTVELFFRASYYMAVSYNFIRRIIVNYTLESIKLYIDLLQSPLLYEKQEKITRRGMHYDINYRIHEYQDLQSAVIGKANILLIELSDKAKAHEIISRLYYRCGKMDINYGNICDSQQSLPPNPQLTCRYFSCNYLISAALNRSYYLAEQCRYEGQIFLSYLCRSFTEEKSLEKALTDILFMLDSGNVFCFSQALPTLYNHYKNCKEGNSFDHYIVPEKSRMIRRAVITPTRVLLYPPEIMFENRVLRNFDSEFALRVSFRDDNFQRLSYNALYCSDKVFLHAIKFPMLQGIMVADRHYKFLAWSNSQIRDHGVWLYACDSEGNDVSHIRRWMGDFSEIHTVPKYMARMGQCFSQTEDTVSVPLEREHVRIEEDITGGYNPPSCKPYCFSDGIGRISVSLAKKVHDVLGHDKHCSAFQIRYGGCKGMLVVDPTLVDTDIVFRKSMVKFSSPKNIRLEIAKTSGPSTLKLNRPFITILNDMGVKPGIFLRLQEDMLRALTEMLLNDEKAAEYLLSKTPSQFFKYKELCESGVGLTTEPFFRSLLLALNIHHIEKIKTKANIDIDPDDGRNMFGVLDETGQLQYGEVFVQYTKDISFGETTKDTIIVKGTVLVTKNPCMYPGDVRKFQAVDIPALHHIVDCIVFPQRGERPHPNEMAGSDLDGDEYAVLWKKELIFKRENHMPGKFPSLSATEKYPITETDMIDFLVEYIRNDQVGVISNAHLAHADMENIFSETCKSIALKCSIAVDFAKTGAKAHLDISERPQGFPDFMEKNYKKTYISRKALGKMFRVSKDFETDSQYASYDYSQVQVDPALVYPGWEIYESDAIKCRDKYNALLYTILQTYGVAHETEAFSGAFLKFHCRFHERKDRAEVEKVVIGSIKALCKNMKKEFLSEFDTDANVLSKKLLQKASAWYVVTYRDGNVPFLSFPWIVSGFLANIRFHSLSTDVVPFYTPVVQRLNTDIQAVADANFLQPLPSAARSHLEKCYFLCGRKIVERSLCVMINWAIDMGVIQDPGYCRIKGFMFLEVFVRLFLHVASLEHYVKQNENLPGKSSEKKYFSPHSSAALCLAFLRFCISLRFCNKDEVKKFVPFYVYKHKWLAKRAVHSYHRIAITGVFNVLSSDVKRKDDLIEMKPMYVESSAFSVLEITEDRLSKAADIIKQNTGVESITLTWKRAIGKVVVNAYGSENSVHILKCVMRKEPHAIREYFPFF